MEFTRKNCIVLSRGGVCTFYLDSEDYTRASAVDVEVQQETRLLRVKFANGLTLPLSGSKNNKVNLPRIFLSKIIPDRYSSMRVELTKKDDGWFYGSYSVTSCQFRPRIVHKEKSIDVLTPTRRLTLEKIKNGAPYLMRGDKRRGRYRRDDGKDYRHSAGSTCLRYLMEKGYIAITVKVLDPLTYYPVAITPMGLRALEE